MSKITLVLSDKCYTSFDQPWIVDMVKDYFDICYIEHDPIIDRKALFVTNVLASEKQYNQNYKLIIDNLWEIPKEDNRGLVLTSKNWFWYNESLWYQHLDYHEHEPNLNIQKNGLLLMNLKKPHRDWLFEKLDLQKILYSYVGKGIKICNDINQSSPEWQRYFNPIWYNSTAFSIVAETGVSNDQQVFITEKTFKPIAFQHPFIVFGQQGVLTYLKTQGFETFENVFDESYDDEYDVDKRLNNIVNQVNEYSYKSYDLYTISKLKHNKELFFNQQLIKDRIIKEIVEPILEYAET
jgi:hypothetical protein